MTHCHYLYTGEAVPELRKKENAAFFLNLQKAVLYSLEKRKLLTPTQRERCIERLERTNQEKEGYPYQPI